MMFLSDKALGRLRGSEAADFSATRYTVRELIARGGMGAVYAAEDEKLSRRVALKVLDFADTTGELTKRLEREAHILAQLEHPGIVPVHDVGVLPDGRVYYTMKLVEGLRLDQYLTQLDFLPQRLRLFLRICDAVAFAHARGVVHRDLKPANIMVGSFGEVLVMDWGLAKILREHDLTLDEKALSSPKAETENDSTQSTVNTGHGTVLGAPGYMSPEQARGETDDPSLYEKALSGPKAEAGNDSTQSSVITGHGTVLGTPGYMSPEQARGETEQIDLRSDIFSLGALLRFMVADRAQVQSLAPPRPLSAICAKATAESPKARYAGVSELSADVSRYLDGLPVTAYSENIVERFGRFYKRHEVAILLITAYLVMRALVLFFFHR